MNKKVSNIQMGMLLSLVMIGFYLGMGDIILLRKSSNEVLISMLLGSIIGLIPLFMYLKINDTYPNLNIYDKVNKMFGKKIGLLINVLIIVSYSLILAIATRTIVSFTTSKYLENTPYIVVGALVLISCFIATFNGLETILRLAQISFVITIFFALLIEITISGYIDINNMLPIFTSKSAISNIIYGSLYYACITSFLSVLLLSIKKDEIKNNKKYNKIAIGFYFYSVLSLILVMFFVISCFGYKMSSLFRYPEYMVLKKIGFSSSELHLENLLAFRWIFYSLALTCTSLYGIITGIKNYSKKEKKNKIIVIIIGFISMLIGKYVLGTVPNALLIMKNYYIPFMAIPMFILLSIIFLRCIFVKSK